MQILVDNDDVGILQYNYRLWAKRITIKNKNILSSLSEDSYILGYLLLNTQDVLVMKYIISTGVITEKDLVTAIEISMKNGYLGIVQALLDNGNLTESLRNHILYCACITNTIEVFERILLSKEEKVKFLKIAILRKSLNVSLFLISTVSLEGDDLEYCLKSAVKNGFQEILPLIMKKKNLELCLLTSCECESSSTLVFLLKTNSCWDFRERVIKKLVSENKHIHIVDTLPYWK